MGHKNKVDRQKWYDSRREECKRQMVILKSKPCSDCGGSFPHYVMDWDHVPERGKKISCVSGLVSGRKITASALQEEMKKCDLVCANCHKIRTHKRLCTRSHLA